MFDTTLPVMTRDAVADLLLAEVDVVLVEKVVQLAAPANKEHGRRELGPTPLTTMPKSFSVRIKVNIVCISIFSSIMPSF